MKSSHWSAMLGTLAMITITSVPQTTLAQSKPYRGGEYRTKDSYKYGRYEVRMKSVASSGMLTSFFTFHDPVPFSAANWNEIDLEILGRYNSEVQYNTITPNRIDHVHRQAVSFNPHKAFHIYAIEWTPDYVAWQVDGYEVYRQTAAHIQTLDRPQKIMMNIWQPIYEDWAGSFNPGNLPLYGYYDWVKYYDYTPTSPETFTLRWHDQFDAWDQARWEKATHTFDGNNAQFIHDNVAFQDGYIILCLSTPALTGYRGGAVVDEDVDPPYLVWARAEDARLIAYFSEELEQQSAETASNYVAPGLVIGTARLLANGRNVELLASGIDLSRKYVLVASRIKDRSPVAHQMGVQSVPVSSALRMPIKINIGGGEELGYLPDQTWDFYQEYGAAGGEISERPAGTVITGTTEDEIYATEREGVSFVQVRLSPGRYDVTLMMADSRMTAAGERVFDIYAEGNLVYDDVDVVVEAGMNAALEKTLRDFEVTDGVLDIYFKAEVASPVLSGVRIQRLATGVKEGQSTPREYGLRIYPNPVKPATNLIYTIVKAGQIEISLFDTAGRRVKRLFKAHSRAGTHALPLDFSGLSTGVYFVAMNFENEDRQVGKAVYLK